MKLKLSELLPNPFKKEINKGKLNKEQVDKIKGNIKKLGLMGSIPIVKRDDKYYLVNAHHRCEALKQEFGKDYSVEVTVHDYDDDTLLRGMVVENLSQRGMDFREESQNVQAVKKHLETGVRSSDTRDSLGRKNPADISQGIGSRQIAEWMNNVISKSKVAELLKINEKIPQELIDSATHKQGDASREGLKYDQLVSLSKLDDEKEIEEVAEALKVSENQRVLDHRKYVKDYIGASDEIKEQVKSGELDIKDVELKEMELSIKDNSINEKSKFVPNFEGRLQDFGYNVTKLEQQVAMFRRVFKQKNFFKVYNNLGKPERDKLSSSIHEIHSRIQSCHNEVQFFINQMEG